MLAFHVFHFVYRNLFWVYFVVLCSLFVKLHVSLILLKLVLFLDSINCRNIMVYETVVYNVVHAIHMHIVIVLLTAFFIT